MLFRSRRFSEGTSADREIQRTLMELLNQLDGFDGLGKVKMICATNRPDVLDPALLRHLSSSTHDADRGASPETVHVFDGLPTLVSVHAACCGEQATI